MAASGVTEIFSSLFKASSGGLSLFSAENPYRRNALDSAPTNGIEGSDQLNSSTDVPGGENLNKAARKQKIRANEKEATAGNLKVVEPDVKKKIIPAEGRGKKVATALEKVAQLAADAVAKKKRGSVNDKTADKIVRAATALQESPGVAGIVEETKRKRKQVELVQEEEGAMVEEQVAKGRKKTKGGGTPPGQALEAGALQNHKGEMAMSKQPPGKANAKAGGPREKDEDATAKGPPPGIVSSNPATEQDAELPLGSRIKRRGISARRAADEDSDEEEVRRARNKKQKKMSRAEEEARLPRTVFVGNLATGVKRRVVAREFARFGEVESVRTRSVPLAESKLPRKAAVITGKLSDSRQSCNAYVVFKSEEGAKAALAHNMAEFEGRHIRVDLATPAVSKTAGGSSSVEYDKTRSVFVGNLPFDIEEEELHTLFGSTQGAPPGVCGKVEGIRVVRDSHTNVGKGIAFVLFQTKDAARAALTWQSPKLRDRDLRLMRIGGARPFSQRMQSGRPQGGMKPARPVLGGGPQGQRESRGPASFEGIRSSKPGKGGSSIKRRAAPAPLEQAAPRRGGGTKKSMRPENRLRANKRPAVAARKQTARAGETQQMPFPGKSSVAGPKGAAGKKGMAGKKGSTAKKMGLKKKKK